MRSTKKNGLNFCGLLLTSLAFAFQADAFTLNSSSNNHFAGWADPHVQVLINSSNCPAGKDIAGLVSDSVSVWNNLPSSNLKIDVVGTTTSTSSGYPIPVYCETNFQTVTGADQNYVPAAAAVSTSGDHLVSGVIYLNVSAGSANISSFDPTTTQIVLAHEVGHAIGLGHSQDSNALMYYSIGSKTNLALAQDDVDGATFLYPRNELGPDKIGGCGLVTDINPPKPPSGKNLLLTLFFLMLPVLAGLRLRSRRFTF
jgi:Matrixin